MKKIKNLLFIALLATFSTYSQSNFWSKNAIEKTNSLDKMERASMPTEFQIFSLDLSKLKQSLQLAPLDTQTNVSNVIIDFPNSEGELENFRIFEAPVLSQELAFKFPNIKSYIGFGLENPTSRIRFSVTIFGLHTMNFSGNGETCYIDTFTKDLNNYIVYNKSNVSPSRNFNCLVSNNTLDSPQNLISSSDATILRASDGNFRIFRLAMASTIEYSAFHINNAGLNAGTTLEKKAAVLAAMGVTMTRVNGVYEKDMSLRMTLIPNNDELIFIDTDDFTNDDPYALIDEGQAQITDIIGNANFDIGHTVSTEGGGLAGPSPCVNGQKASGITGLGSPVGDSYDIDYVAHEMGHQFGANHTYRNSCGGNVNNATAVEPGSGSTIMAYAGICPPNVQNYSDAHFHTVSIDEMVSLIINSANCANTTPNNNAAPVVNAGLDYTIPKGTAFILKGSATDANGDAMTYCWEQTNNQNSAQPPTATAINGPNFRSFPPNISPNRYMPRLQSVIAGNLVPTWEVTTNVARTFNFALTVRDNRTPLGGQTKRDNMIVTVNGTAGPFAVTSQSVAGIIWNGASSQTINWNVAGTDVNNVNTANVNILLSTDSGLTFPNVLIANTPNDGSETFTVPNNITSANCRLMVESVGNIFYAVNSRKFTINSTLATNNFGLEGFALYPNPNNGDFTIQFNSKSTNDIKVNVHDLRGRSIFEQSYENTGIFSQNIALNKLQSGVYLVSVLDGDIKVVKRIVVK